MAQTIQTEFGYHPYRIDCRVGPIEIKTLPGQKDHVATVEAYDTVDDGWVFILPKFVRRSEGAGNRIFRLPKTHVLTHGAADSPDHIDFHIWALSFFSGMRLTTTDAGFVDATPIRPYKLVDFSMNWTFEPAIQAAEQFWVANRSSPENPKRFAAAVHALFTAKNPRLFQFEEFIYLYTALDACFRLAYVQSGLRKKVPHNERIYWICDRFGLTAPPWSGEVARIRNDTLHEALFMGEPLGFALHGVGANENPTLEMSALICRLLVALVGDCLAEYVRSPINTRSMHSLNFYAQELCQRLEKGDARALRIASESDLSGFPVEANQCHANVASWVANHIGHRHVRGWLVTETIGGYVFDKHSVVGIGDDLLDITPRRVQFVCPFLIYQGTREEFERPPQQMIGLSSSDRARS